MPARPTAASISLILMLLFSLLATAQEPAPTLSDIPIRPTTAADNVAQGMVDATTQAAEATVMTVQTFLERVRLTPQTDITRIMLLTGGVVLLLAGWRVYEYIVIIAGFIIGATAAAVFTPPDNLVVNILLMIGGGAIGAILSTFIYPAAVFLIGAWVGVALTGGVSTMFSVTNPPAVLLLLGGLAGGLVLLAVSTQFLIVLSAIAGAQMLTLSLGLGAIWAVILAVIGVIVQMSLVRALNYEYPRSPRRFNVLRR